MAKGLSSLAGIVACLIIVAGAPAAQAAKRRVGVSLTGASAGTIHEAIATALRHHGFETVSADLGSGDSDDAIASAAKQSHLAAVVVGEVRDGGKRLKLRVYGAGGDLIGEGSWSEGGGARKLAAAVERTLWARVGGALSKAHASGEKAAEKPEAEEASPAEEKTPATSGSKETDTSSGADEGETPRKHKKRKAAASEEEEESSGVAGAVGTALDLAVGPRFVSRHLAWTSGGAGTGGSLLGYTLGFVPSVGATFAWYPAAHVMGGWASNLGIAGSIEYTPGLVSQTGDGTSYPTNESDYWAGARFRQLLGGVELSATLGGGQQTAIFHSPAGTTNRSMIADLPDVQYTYARVGLDARIALPQNLALMLGAGYRYVIGAGKQNYLLQATNYLPNATFVSLDVTAGVGWRFLSMLEVRGGFDLRRYQISAGASTRMDTGGVDQYPAFWLDLALLIDGVAAGEGGAAAAPRKAAAAPADQSDAEGASEAPKKAGKGDDE